MTTISDKLTNIYNAKKDIKSAITEKGQSVGDNILDYAAAIRSIEQGSGGSSVYRNWWKVYFIDYDGTVLDYQEVNDGADFVFPDAPDHTDKELVFTGWNQTSNHTTDYDPQDIYTIVIGALYDTVGNTKLMLNAHSLTMTTGFKLTSKVADGITIDWGDGTTTTSSSTSSTEYTHTYDMSYLGKDVVIEIQCADGNTYTFDKVKTGLDNIMPTNVKLGKGCTSIIQYAFRYCDSLQSVNIPSSVTDIGSQAFSSCYSLQSVNIPSSVKSFSSNILSSCDSLQSVTIPSGVKYIDGNVFQGCSSLQSISIPSSVILQSYSVLLYCYPLLYSNNLCNPYNANSIYNIVELKTNSTHGNFVKSVTIPSSVTSIGQNAFQNCYSLQSVSIPSGVKSIGQDAFSSCYSLQSVSIPSSVTKISGGAFRGCYNLQSVTIPSGVTDIGSVFSGCYSLKSVNIPSSVTSIGSSAFSSCYSLKSVSIQSSVTKIDSQAFRSCYSLKSVNIPSSVTKIELQAFYGCSSLQSVSIPSSVTSISSSAFENTNCILDFGNERTTVPTLSSTNSIGYNFCIVPDALYDTWCAATNWSTMTNKIIKYSDYHK